MKVIVVDAAWSKRKAFFVGAIVAATAVVLWWSLSEWNEAWDYQMPDLLFFPLFVSILLLYPLFVLVRSYPRLPFARRGLVFVIGYGTGFYLAFVGLEIAEYGIWWGLPTDEETVGNLLLWHAWQLALFTAVWGSLGMAGWGLCRFVRGKVHVQDGTLCSNCAYSLVGNVSGTCPECGTAVRASIDAREA